MSNSIDRRKSPRTPAGRRKWDTLPGHIPGIVNEERWRVIGRIVDEIYGDPASGGRVTAQTWGIMSERDRKLFAEYRPEEVTA